MSIIAIVATNIYYILWLLIDASVTTRQIINGLSFYEFVVITNGALLIICILSITYKRLGDRLLKWGYSNILRFIMITMVSLLFFISGSIILFSLHFKLKNAEDIYASTVASIDNSYFIPLVFFFGLTSILMFFISNLERRSGNVFRLIAQSMGNSLQPKLIERGFMFIDLNDATSLAEDLGERKYANLLRDCFRMLNELVERSSFEIYQYVGDEVVITWQSNYKNADLKALQLFADYKAYLIENKNAFLKAYGIQPKFKCAIHYGEVVVSEIGKEVKHLVYHGDVLNTTSRLLSKCHFYHTDCIISTTAINNAKKIKEHFALELLAINKLKGKEYPVEAYKVKSVKDIESRSSNDTPFFLNPKVTISHY
ncbi:adenylate/guanylate cyclase domain-containing protein [Winogradskyella sp.]|uniref:adenylate/guanylate cyclase domain-containing protein n=1 Tax=Winogradskyella sp. TaxID=1883156 RepID=UPI00260601DA|nr:adenylate/guanylate cyclase domain-containing protein [Winogradskyella sp.]